MAGAALALAALMLPSVSQAAGVGRGHRGPRATGRNLELRLQADRHDYARTCLDHMVHAIRRDLEADGIAITRLSAGDGRLSFQVGDPARRDAALSVVRARHHPCDDPADPPGWEIQVAPRGTILVRQTPAGLARGLGHELDATLAILANRITALGSSLVFVRRLGPDRLVVQAHGISDPAALRALVAPPARLEFRLVDPSATAEQLASGRAPEGSEILPYPEGGQGERIAVRREAAITSEMIAGAAAATDRYSGRPIVNITFSPEGRRRFALVTRENVRGQFAILVDGRVITVPRIYEPIVGPVAQLDGSFTTDSANALAIRLGPNPLPLRFIVTAERRF